MKKLELNQMEEINGGISRLQRNAGCGAMGLAAGISTTATIIGFWAGPIVGGLTAAGCIMLTDCD